LPRVNSFEKIFWRTELFLTSLFKNKNGMVCGAYTILFGDPGMKNKMSKVYNIIAVGECA